ncbi:hypothetical protein AB0399_40245, partial [Streptomyces sp. NPDC088194]|uniref:hypothetical protein n=1 Tax=Streptomyces sp. NPDC088194 TaxID=3154931 RepID=UPI00344E8940
MPAPRSRTAARGRGSSKTDAHHQTAKRPHSTLRSLPHLSGTHHPHQLALRVSEFPEPHPAGCEVRGVDGDVHV